MGAVKNIDFALTRSQIGLVKGNFMYFKELNNSARRNLIDVQQRFEVLRAAQTALRHRFPGYMSWKARGSREYLYRRHRRVEKCLGPRSPETEQTYEAFTAGKAQVEHRAKGLKAALAGMARVNRALALGRVPTVVSRILRRLDEAGVLGEQVCVVGTNALFAYEAHAGIQFENDLLATDDIDIALDARRNLGLASRMMPEGLIGLLQKIDPSFSVLADGSFRAVNASGLMVDLITPEPRNHMSVLKWRRIGQSLDITAAEVPRLEMIVDAPRFTATAVAEDGLPVWIATADPRWWAAHKLWLAAEPTREPLKRHRDASQGLAVSAMLAQTWEPVDLSDEALASIPAEVRHKLREAVSRAGPGVTPEW
jgi:hypothetical protein